MLACTSPSARSAASLADLPLRALHELEDPDRPTLGPAAQRQPERGGRLAFHLTGMDDHQRSLATRAGGQAIVWNRRRFPLRHIRLRRRSALRDLSDVADDIRQSGGG